MYRHGMHRVATEYGATCLYLWLVAHSTGTLQQALVEILLDEINHMTKFLGFGIWAFPRQGDRLKNTLTKILTKQNKSINLSPNRPLRALFHTFGYVMDLVDWQTWHPMSKLELTYTFIQVLWRLWHWGNSLSVEYLQQLLGTPPSNLSIQI
jgi:hypothetical protein